MKNKPNGFTIVELLIAIQITLLLIGFIYSIYIFTLKLSNSWEHKVRIESVADLCMRTLTKDLIETTEIIEAVSDSISFLNIQGNKINYICRNGKLFRNQKIIHSDGVEVLQLRFRFWQNDVPLQSDLAMPDDLDPFQHLAKITRKQLSQVSLLEIWLLLSDQKRKLNLRSSLHPRNIKIGRFSEL